ncbi:MAG: prephenate dehydrogenase/arogenate dehydrogenase family protein, partial [Alphaproteobacteria bacterium]
IAHALRAAGSRADIRVLERDEAMVARVTAAGLPVDRVSCDPAVMKVADLVILAVPMGAYGDVGRALAGQLKAGAIVTDVGSTKRHAIAALAPHLPEGTVFVPGHPVAGTEHSGPEAGFADLFAGRWTILTPPAVTPREAVEKVAAFWRALGAKVEEMTPDHHDRVMAVVSHIPHLIAYTIVGTASDMEGDDVSRREVMKYAAGGFRDFTRIAASDPVMWRDIFLANHDAVADVLARLKADLARLEQAMAEGDGRMLEEWFTRTRAIRRGVLAEEPMPSGGANEDGPP